MDWEKLSEAIDEFEQTHDKSMNIDGGLLQYGDVGERYDIDKPPFGRKVKYLNENGRDCDKELANKYFTKGQILTVKEIYVGSWCSDVEFVEAPDVKFNTVMFADVED